MTVFFLSPARCDGRRAAMLMNEASSFDLAVRLRRARGVPIGEAFSFMSGLYFRGKLAYARAFGATIGGEPASFVMTTDRGLLTIDAPIVRNDLVLFSRVDLSSADERFIAPLTRDVEALVAGVGRDTRFVLLGSIATNKYVDALTSVLGERLLFPVDFVGRGDMSRGGLLLRHADEGRELEYAPVLGAVRHGKRPPKLAPRRR